MKIKQLLNKKEKWIKGAMAVDKNGNEVKPRSKIAASFCLLGAVTKCYKGHEMVKIRKMIEKEVCKDYRYYSDLPDWNDSKYRKFEDVKKLVNRLDI